MAQSVRTVTERERVLWIELEKIKIAASKKLTFSSAKSVKDFLNR